MPHNLNQEAFALAVAAYGRKQADMQSTAPTEKPYSGGGPVGHAIRAYLDAIKPSEDNTAPLISLEMRAMANRIVELSALYDQLQGSRNDAWDRYNKLVAGEPQS